MVKAREEPSLPHDLESLAALIRECTRCGLHEGRTRAVPGEGPRDARIVLLGEAPGAREDAQGRPFVGAGGKILDEALARAGIPRRGTFLTNVVKCRPPENRKPKATEMAACRPYLLAQLETIRPRVIVALGRTAIASLLRANTSLEKIRRSQPSFSGTPVVPTYHPAAVLRNRRRLFRRLVHDLRKARRHAEGR